MATYKIPRGSDLLRHAIGTPAALLNDMNLEQVTQYHRELKNIIRRFEKDEVRVFDRMIILENEQDGFYGSKKYKKRKINKRKKKTSKKKRKVN